MGNMKVIDVSMPKFSPNNLPFAHAQPGEVLLFKTLDCFAGQITDESQLVDGLDLNTCNPAAGPVYLDGAEPGDVLVVDILDVQVAEKGFVCSMPGDGPLFDLIEARTRVIPVENGVATFNGIQWLVRPMIGVIGTAPAEGEIPCGFAGNHGGNLDSKLIRKGARLYLPVRVPGALLQMGDLHAAMGDGELCGTGIEISGEVTVRTSLLKKAELHWPVTETLDYWYVNTVDADYDRALLTAAHEMARLLGKAYGWDATECNMYFSLRGEVGINQGVKPMPIDMFVLRLGVPKVPGKPPLLC